MRLDSAEGRLLLYAPNVHTGGGLVLLQAFLSAWPADRRLHAFLDARARPVLNLPDQAAVSWVRPRLFDRLAAEWRLRRAAQRQDTVLCMHCLPPLLRSRAQIFVFQQNRLYFRQTPLDAFGWRTRQRVRVEQWLASSLKARVDRYWVQTPSMARDLLRWYGLGGQGRPLVQVLPFMARDGSEQAEPGPTPVEFVYVAEGLAHKNHRKLVQAWVLLARQGLRPGLVLTLQAGDGALARWIEAQAIEHGLDIKNLGPMPHAEVLALYRRAKALVFPSLSESLGLPLIEARAAGLPILAGELDYVRDVCEPVQTFDPGSEVSIARAVMRFLQQADSTIEPVSAAAFLQAVNEAAAERVT